MTANTLYPAKLAGHNRTKGQTMTIITTKRDLRNWVDNATSDWPNRNDSDVDTITNAIQADDHPVWGSDWSEFLASLDLVGILDDTTARKD